MGSSAVFTKFTVFTEPTVEDSVYQVIKVNKAVSVYRLIKVNEGFSAYRVIKENKVFSSYHVNQGN